MPNAATAMSRVNDPRATGGLSFRVWQLWRVFNAEAVASTNTVDSIMPSNVNGLAIAEYAYFGLWIQLSSSGTPSVNVQIIQSWDDTAANYVVPNTAGTIVTGLNDTNAHVYPINPTPLPYLRVRLVGTGSNPADVTATVYIWMTS